MSAAPTTADVDRNLLFAVIALQDDLIDQAQFADVCGGWAMRMDRSMADLLLERGWLTQDDCADVERKLKRKLAKHRGDVRATLGIEAKAEARDLLRTLDYAPVRQSLDGLPPATGHVMVATLLPSPSQLDSTRYTLTRLHAEGGLGKVWIARDTDLNREVALKEIRTEKSGNPESWKRFLKEAQITSQLEHPFIVPVYELARRKEDDQPFYTMRFVRGQSLREAIAAYHKRIAGGRMHRLELQRELLEPFIKICEAVGYAHSRGVIHRDLKPENVVLGSHGEVIVLDWGLAKTLDSTGVQPGPEPSVTVTDQAQTAQTLAAVGTPAYMAPEQVEARADLIDAKTDIYGLGGILFEILTGCPPAQGKTANEVFQTILWGRLPRARELNPMVPKALEAICAQALQKDRAQRYASASELAEDVRRWLVDAPVSVYRDPLTVRLTRWARRHRTLVASLAVLLTTTVLGLTLGLVSVNREREKTEQQRRRAVANEKQALENLRLAQDAADGLLSGVADIDLADIPQMEPVRRQLLEMARADYEKFLAQKGDDPLVRWGAARSRVRLADIEALLGDVKSAQASYEAAIEPLKQLIAEAPGNNDFTRDLARAWHGLGVVLKDAHRYREAESALREAIKLREQVAESAHDRQSLADSRYQLGTLLARMPGRREDNAKAYREALEVLSGLEATTRDRPEFRARRARYRNNEAILQSAIGGSAEAEIILSSILEDLKSGLEGPEALPGLRWNWARAANNLGKLYLDQQRTREAAALLRQSADRLKTLAAEFPRIPQYRQELASVLYNLGILARMEQDPQRATAAFEESIELLGALVADFPGIPAYQHKLVLARIDLNSMLAHSDAPAAERALREAIQAEQALVQEYPAVPEYLSALGQGHFELGRLFQMNKQYAPAEAEARAAADAHRRVLKDWPDSVQDQALLARDLGLLAYSRKAIGKLDEALATAAELPTILPKDPEAYFQAAALIVQLTRESEGAALDARQLDAWHKRAVDLLKLGAERGMIQWAEELDLDALAPLEGRPDFEGLRRGLPSERGGAPGDGRITG